MYVYSYSFGLLFQWPGLNTIPIPDHNGADPRRLEMRWSLVDMPNGRRRGISGLTVPGTNRLPAETQLLDDRLVAPVGMLFEVVQKFTAAARHLE
jgi:hypothetical protein